MRPAVIGALLILPAAFAAGSERKFTDALSLLSKLNSNPSALNAAASGPPVSLSQATVSGRSTAGIDSGLKSLGGLGGGEAAAAAGSDAAADAVSDSIKDLFNLPVDAASKATKAVEAPVAEKTKVLQSAPKVPAPEVSASAAPKPASEPKKVTAVKAAPAAPTKTMEAPKSAPKPVETVATKKQATPVPKPAAAVKPVAKPAVAVKPVVKTDSVKKPVAKPAAAKTTPARAAQTAPTVQKKTKAVTALSTLKHPTVTKTVVTPKVSPSQKVKPVLIARATAQGKNKAAVKVEELEAEVNALKAQLATAAPTPKPAVQAMVAKPVNKAQHDEASAKPKAVPAKKVAPTATAKATETKAPAPKAAQHKKASPVAAEKPKPPVVKPVAAKAVMKTIKRALPAVARAAHSAPKVEAVKKAAAQTVHTAQAAESDAKFEEDMADAPVFQMPEAKPKETILTRPKPVPAPAPVPPKAVSKPAPVTSVSTPPEQPAAAVEQPAAPVAMTMVPMNPDSQSVAPAIAPVAFFGSMGHWFHSLFFADPPPAPAPTQAPPPDPNAGRPAFSKQDIERTQESAFSDARSDVAIADDFARRESEDLEVIDQVKREDRALRIEAQTPKRPAMPAPPNFKHESGSTHISSFWGTLAEEDADIEATLNKDGDDLSEYERLKSLQDAKVHDAVSSITSSSGDHLAIERRSLRKAAAAA